MINRRSFISGSILGLLTPWKLFTKSKSNDNILKIKCLFRNCNAFKIIKIDLNKFVTAKCSDVSNKWDLCETIFAVIWVWALQRVETITEIDTIEFNGMKIIAWSSESNLIQRIIIKKDGFYKEDYENGQTKISGKECLFSLRYPVLITQTFFVIQK